MAYPKSILSTLTAVIVSVAIWVSCFLSAGCGVLKKPPVIRDSIAVHHTYIDVIRDSVVVVPVERVVNVVKGYDTLRMETSLAVATAWADTTLGVVKGELKNKQNFSTKIEYREIVKTDTLYRYKEVPKEVIKVKYRTPKSVAFLALLGVLGIGYVAVKIWRKFL